MAIEVMTRINGTLPLASRATDTADLGTGISPTKTSADTHSGMPSPTSSLRATLKSSGDPSTGAACALAKPIAQAGAGTDRMAAADKAHSPRRFGRRVPKELGTEDE